MVYGAAHHHTSAVGYPPQVSPFQWYREGSLVLTKPILIVDDSPTIRRMVRMSLAGLGAPAFVEAATGLEAIEQLILGPVGLIILDLNMPDMHGLEVLK